MAATTAEWAADESRIRDVIQELNQARNVPRPLRDDLESRLVLAWGKTPDPQDKSTTAWRKRHAMRMYREVQSENQHLFLAFVLAVAPTACGRTGFRNFVQSLLTADEDRPLRLQLGERANEMFESMAVRREFVDNPRYVEFRRSLFSELEPNLQDVGTGTRHLGTCEHRHPTEGQAARHPHTTSQFQQFANHSHGSLMSSPHGAVLPLTAQDAEVLLQSVRDDVGDGMTMVFPHTPGNFPYIVLSYRACANIMRLYTL